MKLEAYDFSRGRFTTKEYYDFVFARLYQFNYGNNEVTFIPEKDEEYFNISNERIKNAKTKGE